MLHTSSVGIIVLLLVVLIIATGCSDKVINSQDINPEKTPPQNTKKESKLFSMEDVAKHNTRDDCWLLIHDKVYDLTAFIDSHPGGVAILEGCGRDATELFETRPMGSKTPHSDKARTRLDEYYIGDLR